MSIHFNPFPSNQSLVVRRVRIARNDNHARECMEVSQKSCVVFGFKFMDVAAITVHRGRPRFHQVGRIDIMQCLDGVMLPITSLASLFSTTIPRRLSMIAGSRAG